MTPPNATYRVQLHAEFTLADLAAQLDYLRQLGVDTVYASPVLAAAPGSTHGYDVTDPGRLNPELGSEADWRAVTHAAGLGWMQDIVPNHVALSTHNPWLIDVLTHGRESRYAHHFDIDWDHPDFGGRMLLPVLGGSLEDAIREGHLAVEEGTLRIYDRHWPLRPGTDTTADLAAVIDRQHYRPAHWQSASQSINYRRFFTVNELMGVRTEDDAVFADLHARTLADLRAGRIQHLRLDHVDGLLDPTGYLRRLRAAVGPEVGLYVEKILEPGERLPADWPVQGTTGYDFLAAVNRLLTDEANGATFSALYERLTGEELPDYAALVFRNKLMLVREHFGGELDNLVRRWAPLVPEALRPELRMTLAHWLAAFPVYRIYPTGGALTAAELEYCQEAAVTVTHHAPQHARAALAFTNFLAQTDFAGPALEALQRTQQLSGPLMAKGVEDTTFYQFWRQAHLNEVGGSADPAEGLPARAFHRFIRDRPATTMNATATHDTKRGEDARAFLQALSFYPAEWRHFVEEIGGLVDTAGVRPRGFYLVLQCLVGSFPLHKSPERARLRERLAAYLSKALREGKEMSDWAAPNEAYEARLRRLTDELLDNRVVVRRLRQLLETLWPQARHNSWAQLLLKCTVPGFPDVYQGTESWDLSFVDPDNRRPVDYAARRQWLQQTEFGDHCPAQKAQLLHFLLQLRRDQPDFFRHADYRPTEAGADCLAFRRHRNGAVLSVGVAKRAGGDAGAVFSEPNQLPEWAGTGLYLHFAPR